MSHGGFDSVGQPDPESLDCPVEGLLVGAAGVALLSVAGEDEQRVVDGDGEIVIGREQSRTAGDDPVPVGVGVITHLDVVSNYGLRLLAIVAVSTWIGMAVTALVLRAMLRASGKVSA